MLYVLGHVLFSIISYHLQLACQVLVYPCMCVHACVRACMHTCAHLSLNSRHTKFYCHVFSLPTMSCQSPTSFILQNAALRFCEAFTVSWRKEVFLSLGFWSIPEMLCRSMFHRVWHLLIHCSLHQPVSSGRETNLPQNSPCPWRLAQYLLCIWQTLLECVNRQTRNQIRKKYNLPC